MLYLIVTTHQNKQVFRFSGYKAALGAYNKVKQSKKTVYACLQRGIRKPKIIFTYNQPVTNNKPWHGIKHPTIKFPDMAGILKACGLDWKIVTV